MNAGRKAKILVVDDRPENLLVYQAVLEEIGEDLVLARSGEEALRQVLHHDFAVILLDVNMPGLDGLETATLIRKRKRSAVTPIIFLTAYSDEVRASEGYLVGAVDYIATPVVPAILRAKVQVFVNLFRMTEEVRQHAEERIAHARERSRLEAAEEANRRLTFLARAGAIIAKSLDIDVTIDSILNLLVPDCSHQAVLAIREDHEFRCVSRTAGESSSQPNPEPLTNLPESWQAAIAHAIDSGQPQQSADSSQGSAGAANDCLTLPLCHQEQVFAVLHLVRSSAAGGFSSGDVSMLESLAWRAAAALVNARLFAQIEHADQQKNRFLSLLAHELRNPLAPIRSAVDVLRFQGQSPQTQEWARDLIGRQVNHIVRLVNDLLDVSRITLGKIRLKTEPIQASEVVSAAIEISRPLIEEGRHELTVHVPDQPLILTGDRARLMQVLSNLLNNAAKFTPSGGSISIAVWPHGQDVVFEVRDSGIGIPAHMLSKVFEMFVQVNSVSEHAQGGLGVGLTLVRQLVELHGGRVEVASDGPGLGSSFTVRIPCAGTHTDTEKSAAPAQALDAPSDLVSTARGTFVRAAESARLSADLSPAHRNC